MRALIALLTVLLFGACTTFNAKEVGRACKSGVQEYDDGTVSFKCVTKKESSDAERK